MAAPKLTIAALLAAALALGGCGEPTKEDILKKAETIDTQADLRDQLGDPDDIAKIGPIERWTYKASNGQVTFVITGKSVTLKAAGAKS